MPLLFNADSTSAWDGLAVSFPVRFCAFLYASFIQYGAMEWKTSELMERAKAAYAAEGHRASSIKSVNLYVKPMDHKAYYVINEKVTGSIDLYAQKKLQPEEGERRFSLFFCPVFRCFDRQK